MGAAEGLKAARGAFIGPQTAAAQIRTRETQGETHGAALGRLATHGTRRPIGGGGGGPRRQ